MSYASEEGVLNAQFNAALAAQQVEEQRMRPFMLLRPTMSLNGHIWCALYGDDLQSGVAGFGDTPEKAALDFDREWLGIKGGR